VAGQPRLELVGGQRWSVNIALGDVASVLPQGAQSIDFLDTLGDQISAEAVGERNSGSDDRDGSRTPGRSGV
jgi:hypothetical protein